MSDMTQPLNENRLLAALPPEEYERIVPHLEPVSLSLGETLFMPDEQIQHVHFLTTAVVSLLTDLEDGSGMEVGLVGREGIVGVSAILGGSETKVATVQAAGTSERLRVDNLKSEFSRGETLQRMLLRYTHALMTQISQSVVCNSRHQVEGRLARWLLMFRDRVGIDEFELTHEFMANMLGVRRASITEIAGKLQEMELIRYQHGHFKILDRKRLEEFTCECYPAIKEKYDDFLL
ncbi:MAG TPA: Crp/Fnr family transcriptional regulator [Pyrinomonadaceae bacterium]|jgi:CRP-like cAMP-binding protein|nr:Crp/Fnr family transcriptional regulator [Pyrinomonadaceae bacterium]